jgi:oligoendopeptidase F
MLMKAPKAPSWSLQSLYKNPEDPALRSDFRKIDKSIDTFVRKYKGKISKVVNSSNELLALLRDYEAILSDLQKPITYAQLLFSEQTSNSKYGAFYQGMRQEYTKRSQRLIFVETDFQELPTAKLKKLVSKPAFKPYQNYLRCILNAQAHHLPEREEQIFADAALTGSSAFRRMFTEEHSRATYSMKKGKKTIEMREEGLLHLLHGKNRDERKAASEALSNGLRASVKRYAFLYNTLLADQQTQDRYRKFELAEDTRHLANQTTKPAVDALVSAVRGSYSLVERFYKLRAKMLGVKDLQDYDRYAPLFSAGAQIPFVKAKDMVVQSFAAFSPVMGDLAKELFSEKRVDAFARDGKRGGAFCDMGYPPNTKPFVFMNYRGTWRDVFTLAHEFGHAAHGYLALHHQSLLNCNSPLTICETASTFAEALLFDYLSQEIRSKQQLLSLYVQRIDDSIATVYRQIGMFLFERDCHALYRKKGELSVEEINNAWYTRQKEMFGSSVKLNPGYELWWAYIPHVFQWPFYVYSYAFGDLLSLSLFDQYKSGQKGFVEKYTNFLAAGSSLSPAELVKPFGAKLDQEAFWKQGTKLIRKQIDRLESLV